jgi:hypothetical protein
VNEPQPSRAKIRIGLGLITVVFAVALAMLFLVEAPAGKAVMFAIALTAFIRVVLLFRSLRSSGSVQ